MSSYLANIGSWLSLNQTVASQPYGLSASNTIAFSQTVGQNFKFCFAQNKLLLNHKFSYSRPVTVISIKHQVSFVSGGIKSQPNSVTNILSLSHAAKVLAAYDNFQQSLRFNQTVVGNLIKPASSFINLVSTPNYNAVFNIQVTTQIALVSSAFGYKLDPNFVAIPIVIPGPPNTGGDDGHGV